MHSYPMNQMPHGQPVQHGTGQMSPYQQPHTPMDPSAHQGTHAQMDPAYQQQIHDLCQRYHHHLMQFETTDGQMHDGIIDGIDRNGVNMLVPVGDTEGQDMDQRYFGGSPYGGYGGYGGYGFPRRFRRFRRRHFPFFTLRHFFFPYFY
ncbi:hypothetical protein N0O92_12570 [Alkalihalobacillus sp. MEB130]|uniref:hypothetical protein n=1 Tax=Alkalihalobacillus sp. MEB130 TaxID=2976704 RepID=UPI0028DFEDC7|nr:hypothetical protein [Alkalihalobacillus sp. MEB130]MDT8861069.1 hypothetical protein [Alkalihalobacillus sp. MEB130]